MRQESGRVETDDREAPDGQGPDMAEAALHGGDYDAEDQGGNGRAELLRILVVALALVPSWLGLWKDFASFDIIALAGTAIGAYPIVKQAVKDIAERRMTMELSMTIAIVAAAAIGAFFTSLVIVLFVLIAEVLEDLTVERGHRAMRGLLDLLPHRAIVQDETGTRDVDRSALRVGDVVLIRPGAVVPVDGVVTKGHSTVDQSAVTGESLPAEKAPGAQVYAGTMNQRGALEVRADGLGQDTAVGRIIRTIEEAERSRAPIQRTADRMAGYLVYFALGAAALTFLITRDVRSTISVVIVAGACGIAAGTPLAILGALGQAANRGAIVKGGRYLEELSRVDTVVLDKTGTLTLGVPCVTEVRPAQGESVQTVLAAAASAERSSEHPLASAVLAAARDRSITGVEPDRFDYFPGKGLVCTVGKDQVLVGNRALLAEHGVDVSASGVTGGASSEVLVARNEKYLGAIEVADVLRPEAVEAVRAMRAMGLRTVLLTGDALPIAQAVAAELEIDAVEAELLPDDKVARVRALQAEGRRVVMVGDGINDAPALTQANVSVGMGSGTDIARESADILLLGNDLSRFVGTIQVARRSKMTIWQNFYGTLLVDSFGVVLAAVGLLNPVLAAFIHVSSELVFILNSARLIPGGASRHLVPRDAPSQGISATAVLEE